MAKELIFSDTCIRTEQNDSKYRENEIINMFGVYVKCTGYHGISPTTIDKMVQ
jgi:hypothetical protein